MCVSSVYCHFIKKKVNSLGGEELTGECVANWKYGCVSGLLQASSAGELCYASYKSIALVGMATAM